MKRDIIGIVGPIRAGKSTVSDYICSNYGYKRFTNSAILTEILNLMGLSVSRDNLQNLGDSMLKVLGNDVIAKSLTKKPQSRPFVIDGIRYLEEIEHYRKQDGFLLIAVTAEDEERFNRAKKNSEPSKDSGVTEQKFGTLKNSRSELDLPELIKLADVVIKNSGTLDELYGQVDEFLASDCVSRRVKK